MTAERLDGGLKLKPMKADIEYFSRMVVVEIMNSVKEKLEKKRENHFSLMVGLHLAQKELVRGRRELKEKIVLTESLQETATARKRGGGWQGRGPVELAKRSGYESCVQECFYGFSRVMYNGILR